MRKIILILIASSFLAYAQERKDVAVTIYNSNLGVVKEVRGLDLKSGLNDVFIKDVPSLINPSSVKINLDGTVLEQNYRYDLANSNTLMQHFIDKKIKLMGEKLIEGTLVSATSNSVVIKREDGGLTILPSLEGYNISLDYMPENLLTKPTLVWKVKATKTGKQDAGISYQTGGMSWKAEYVATLNKDDNKLDLNAWVNLSNNSGGSFKNAKIKLIAGDINRANAYGQENMEYPTARYKDMAMATSDLVTEKAFFEYHIYELANRTDLLQNEDKQVGLFNTSGIDVEKKFTYSSNGSNMENQKPYVSIEFKNSTDNKLGMPLPKGIVRIYKNDGEAIELVGEDNLEHTPKNEDVNLKIGEAFDITIDEKVLSSTKITDKVREIEYEVTVHNSKEEPVTVEINRNLWGNWSVIEQSQDFEKENANKITFKVAVGKEQKKTLTYKVRFVY
jgi:hypothetical protein